MQTRKIISGIILIVLLSTMISCGSSSQETETTVTVTPKTYVAYPAMIIDQTKEYTATIKTNYGDIVLELFPDEAPLAVNNFVFLAREGFYDGVMFHRVYKGFVIQSGDPTGTGAGGPGYSFADETITRDYVYGTLAMANSGTDTNGSQFFICLGNLYGLQKKYTIFGLLTEGHEVVNEIGDVPVEVGPSGEASSPIVDVHIDTILIEEK